MGRIWGASGVLSLDTKAQSYLMLGVMRDSFQLEDSWLEGP